MSYFGSFGAETQCPPGWTVGPTGNCVSPPTTTQCPPGFQEKVPGECWPTNENACGLVLGTYFNPAEPDRCKSKCPEGTKSDAKNVCRPVATAATSFPMSISVLVVGAMVSAAIYMSGRRKVHR